MHRIRKLVRDLLPEGEPPAVPLGASVADALAVMRERGDHAVLVLDGERLAGIFTERDALYRIARHGADPAALPVREVMTPDPVTLPPEACVSYAINHMGLENFSNIPVVERDDRVVGLIGVRELMQHMSSVFEDLDTAELPKDADDPWLDIGGGN